MSQYHIDIQIACKNTLPYNKSQIKKIIRKTLESIPQKPCELTLRLVEPTEITLLNKSYRQKDKATNVLAFPSSFPSHVPLEVPFLGDIIVCPAVLETEASEQQIALEAHWTHILIHGVLHLLGYDHIEETDAKAMQALEIQLLANFGFANPYDLLEEDIKSA
jgi:probable rRNA maturation factor